MEHLLVEQLPRSAIDVSEPNQQRIAADPPKRWHQLTGGPEIKQFTGPRTKPHGHRHRREQ